MEKYSNLGALLTAFRKHSNISQLDFAALLDVDVRTVIRWEKNESLIKVEKEKLLIENFGIPHQVIRNLNTDTPIAVYFDFDKWVYSLSFLSSIVPTSEEYRSLGNLDTDRIKLNFGEDDLRFIAFMQKNQKNLRLIKNEVLKAAAQILPELNLIINSHSGYHSGHLAVLPLKYDTYKKLREKQINESQITINDLNSDYEAKPLVFYYYSLYANSIDNTYYMMSKLLMYFEAKKYKDYLLAGISYRYPKIDRLKDIGLKVIWEENLPGENERKATFLSGNLDEFLFNTK